AALRRRGAVCGSISLLLRFARDEALRPSAMRVVDTLDASLETLRERIAQLGVQVERRFDGSGEMIGDSEQLRRVFGNLIGNALDAMEEARTPAPALTLPRGGTPPGPGVGGTTRDNGPGIDAETAPRFFEPFFTSRSNGTGLGL